MRRRAMSHNRSKIIILDIEFHLELDNFQILNNKKIKPKFLKEVFVENTLESQINYYVVIKEEVKDVNGLKPICGIVKE
jgi:hypothetical protein